MKQILVICTFIQLLFGLEVDLFPKEDLTYTNSGENVTALCVITDLAGKTVRWYHKNKLVVMAAPGKSILYMDPNDQDKYDLVAGDSDGGNFILTVLNFTRSDDGEVSCEVTGAQAVSSRFEAIVMMEKLNIFIDGNHRKLKSKDGNQLIFKIPKISNTSIICEAQNVKPRPVISWAWQQDNTSLPDTTESFTQSEDLYNTSSTIFISDSLSTSIGMEKYVEQMNTTLDEILQSNETINDFDIVLTCSSNIEGNVIKQELILRYSNINHSNELPGLHFQLYVIVLGNICLIFS